jgi:CO/xanthine dehydrogenase Mo-binding subunit
MTLSDTTYIRRFFSQYSNEEKEKVRGHAFYLTDYLSALLPEDVAHVAVVRSPHAGATFTKIDSSEALKVKGVLRVITARDIPNNTSFGSRGTSGQLILSESTVRYEGEPVALVVGETLDAATEGLEKVKIDWKKMKLPPEEVVQKIQHKVGKPSRTRLDEVRTSFRMPSLQTRYLEPESGWVRFLGEGLEFHIGALPSESQRVWVSQVLGVPVTKITAKESPLGGQFGGRQQRELLVFLALASFLTKKSVGLHFRPKEQDIGSYGYRGELTLGFDRERKKLCELRGKLVVDAGSYEGSSGLVLQKSLEHLSSIYAFEHLDLHGEIILTPTHPRRALKGEGLTAVTWVTEQLVERVAKELDISSLEFRKQNAAPQSMMGAKVLEEMEKLEKGFRLVPIDRNRPIWDEKEISGRGYGFQNFHPTTAKEVDYSEVSIDLENSGTFVIRTSNLTLDLHFKNALCEVAAKVLKTHAKAFTVEGKMRLDIDRPARRETYPEFYYLAQATWSAAAALRDKILKAGAVALSSKDVILQDGAVVDQRQNRKMGYRELAFTNANADLKSSFLLKDIEKPHGCTAGAVARVSFHPLTGEIRVESVKLVLDAGPVLYSKGLEIQLESAVAWAMAVLFSSEAREQQPIPTPLDGPEEVGLIAIDYTLKDYSEKPPEYFGSRGVTSMMMSTVFASLVNAIYDAKQMPIEEVPMPAEFMYPKRKHQTVHTLPFKR